MKLIKNSKLIIMRHLTQLAYQAYCQSDAANLLPLLGS